MTSGSRCALVTGGSGFVASALIGELAQRGWRVRAATRDPGRVRVRHPNVQVVRVADPVSAVDQGSVLRGVEAVFHLASIVHGSVGAGPGAEAAYATINRDWTTRLAEESASAGVRSFVFVSTVKVNGEESASVYTDSDLPAPVDAYGRSKRDAESAIQRVAASAGMRHVILRPPLVYGPGVRANFLSLLRLVRAGLPLPFAGIRNRRSLVFVGNLVDALVAAAEGGGTAGTYLISDGEDVSTPELVRRIGAAMGRRTPMFSVPPRALNALASGLGFGGASRRLTGSLAVDCSRFCSDFSWRPPVTMNDGVKRTVQWYLGGPRS